MYYTDHIEIENVERGRLERGLLHVVIFVEASVSKVYPRVSLASASTLSGSVVRTFRRTSKGVLSSCVECGASPQPVFDFLRLLFTKGTQWVCGGVDEISVGFHQRSLAGSKARKEDCVRTVANGYTIFRPKEPGTHLRCPRIGFHCCCLGKLLNCSRRALSIFILSVTRFHLLHG